MNLDPAERAWLQLQWHHPRNKIHRAMGKAGMAATSAAYAKALADIGVAAKEAAQAMAKAMRKFNEQAATTAEMAKALQGLGVRASKNVQPGQAVVTVDPAQPGASCVVVSEDEYATYVEYGAP